MVGVLNSSFGEILRWTINILSCCGSLIIYWGAYNSPKGINNAMKLILLLSTADLITNVSAGLVRYANQNEVLCQILMFSKVFANQIGLFCSAAIALLAYYTLKNPRSPRLTRAFRRVVVLCVLLSIFIGLWPFIPIGNLDYGLENGVCALKDNGDDDDGHPYLIFLGLKGISFILAFTLTIWSYIKTTLYLRELSDFVINSNGGVNSRKLLTYPAAQLLLYTPGVIYPILNGFYGVKSDLWNTISMDFCYSLAGFVNFLVYGKNVLFNRSRYKSDLAEFQQDYSVSTTAASMMDPSVDIDFDPDSFDSDIVFETRKKTVSADREKLMTALGY